VSGNLLVTEGLGATGLPVVLLSLAPAAQQLVLTFETNIGLTGESLDASKWTVTAGSGITAVSVSGVSAIGNVITLQTTEHQLGGAYTLHIPQGIFESDGEGRPFIGPFDQNYTGVGVQPTLLMVKGVDSRTIEVVFSEKVNAADAVNTSNYVVTGPSTVLVTSVTRITDLTYRVKTTAQNRAASYTLTVSNVRDMANNPLS